MDSDVSEVEMARRYDTLVGATGRKSAKKKKKKDCANYKEDENGDIKPIKVKRSSKSPKIKMDMAQGCLMRVNIFGKSFLWFLCNY